MMLLRKLFVKPEDLEIRNNDDDDHTSIGQYVIVNPALNGNTIAEITMMTHRKVHHLPCVERRTGDSSSG